MVKDYRKKVSSETGGIKLYHNLKTEMINQDINIGRDKFYDLVLHSLLHMLNSLQYMKYSRLPLLRYQWDITKVSI